MKILLVGGTWSQTKNTDDTYGKSSGLIQKIANAIDVTIHQLDVYNGGRYEDLQQLLEQTPNYNIIFWFANVPDNNLPKLRDVKAVAPFSMLVTSKRNDNQKYTFQELLQRALASKSNLAFEFSKMENNQFHILVHDPLGCSWYDGTNIYDATYAALKRLEYLTSITRQKTIPDPDKTEIVWQQIAAYYESDKQVAIPEEQEFVNLVHQYAETFHKLLNPGCEIKRFLGNCSLKKQPPQVGRCSKGFPSFKNKDYVFVSQRNVDKQYLDLNHFVPCYLQDSNVYYCGNKKPSVDTPIQLRLYQALPNIRYMIHSHCYVKDAPHTRISIPCGGIEEVDEILQLIDSVYNDRNLPTYKINLKGHGSIIMGHNIKDLKNITYIARPMPEPIYQ